MRWKGRRESGNVEDRRGQSGGGGGFRFPFPGGGRSGARRSGRQGGGMGIMGTLIMLAVLFFFPKIGSMLFGGGSPFSPSASNNGGLRIPLPGGRSGREVGRSNYQNKSAQPQKDDMGKFLAVVLADTEDVWTKEFKKLGRRYRSPKLIIFSGRTRTGCGVGTSQMGPFYCPGDQNIYVDPAFYKELKYKFGASGDFAHAYVIAHEVGHHVQTLFGISKKVQQAKSRSRKVRANAIQVRLELQADCFAGVWARQAYAGKNILDSGDVAEAINAAAAIGDDKIQKRMQGYVKPHTFTHGSSAQRVNWFKRGFSSGSLQKCDTFGASQI